MIKTWCRLTSAGTCTTLVTHPRLGQEPGNSRYVIRDHPSQGYFTVIMTALREMDSGLYSCRIFDYFQTVNLKTIRLAVSRGESFPLRVLLRFPEPQDADAGKDLIRSPSPVAEPGPFPRSPLVTGRTSARTHTAGLGGFFLPYHTHFPKHLLLTELPVDLSKPGLWVQSRHRSPRP